MSAVRHPFILKTSTFSIQDCENTFYMSAECISTLHNKFRNYFANKQLSLGIAHKF